MKKGWVLLLFAAMILNSCTQQQQACWETSFTGTYTYQIGNHQQCTLIILDGKQTEVCDGTQYYVGKMQWQNCNQYTLTITDALASSGLTEGQLIAIELKGDSSNLKYTATIKGFSQTIVLKKVQ